MAKPSSPAEKNHVEKAVEIAVRLLAVGIILYASLNVVGPFVTPVAWGFIIAVSLHTAYKKLSSLVGGRDKLAGGIFIVLGLAALFVPAGILTESLLDGASKIGEQLSEGTLQIPPPSESVKEWPIIGETTYAQWEKASQDLDSAAAKLGPQLRAMGSKLAGALANVGGSVMQTALAIVIAGIMLMHAAGVRNAVHSASTALAGRRGPELASLITLTIRSVVKGVLAVAFLQSVLAAVGLFVAGVPWAGLWALLVLILAIVQLPPLLVLGPIAFWLFSATDSTGMAIFFLIWSVLVSFSDMVLKPLFLGRGVEVPMLVILIGAIGGMLRFGIVGLFTGAVTLAIGYQLVVAWVEDANKVSAAEAEAS